MSTSSLPEHIASYRERSWDVYELPLAGDQPSLTDGQAVLWCNSDSEQARRLGDAPARLYVDLELLAADRDPSAGCQIGRLAEEWQGHPPGTLAIVSFELVRSGQLVYLLERV